MRTIIRAFLRYLIRRKGLSLLQFFGIACGAAAVVGITLSAHTALRSFSQAVDFLRGSATHSLERPAGPMEENILPALIRDPAVEALSPVVERRLRLPSGLSLRILGVDPFLDRKMRPHFQARGSEEIAGREMALEFLLDSRSVLVDENTFSSLSLSSGAVIQTSIGELKVLGRFPSPSGEPLVLMDIGFVQSIYGLEGRLDRVDLILSDEEDFRSRWEKGYRIQSNRQRRRTMDSMLRAYRLNLEALSLMALFVGIFLIYNTSMFAVVSRRRDAGILRSLGAGRGEIAAAFLVEILILGVLGGALGGGLGYVLSRLLTGQVGRTISDLYFFLQPAPPEWTFRILLSGAAIGSAASLAGGFLPLRELLGVHPAEALVGRSADRKTASSAGKTAAAGMGLLASSAVLLWLSFKHVYIGFAGAFVFLLGFSLLSGLALVRMDPFLKKVFKWIGGLPGRVAAGNIRLNLGRTSVAVAAFLVALSVSIGLNSMISSFRHSLVWWLDSQISGDLYISSLDERDIPPSLYAELQTVPGIADIDRYRNALSSYQGVPVYVSSVDASVLQKHTSFGFLQGGNENWDRVKRGDVIISESFARRFDKKRGDDLVLEGAGGAVALRIAAVFYDYTSEHGVVMMDRRFYLSIFRDVTIDSLAVFLEKEVSPAGGPAAQIERMAAADNLQVMTRNQLHGRVLRVFDSTFAVTRSMRWLTILVAFFGISGAILTLFMEKQKEFGIYRALGFSTAQVAGMTVVEGLIMGLTSFLLSLAAGTGMAVILIRVINLRSFNWTIFFHLSWGPYLVAGATAVLASLGAAVYPVLKAWRTYPQMQIREE